MPKIGNTRDEAQDAVNNLRRNIAAAKTEKERRQYWAMLVLLKRRYGHLGVK